MKLSTTLLFTGLAGLAGLQAKPPADLAKRQCRSTHLWWKSAEPVKEKLDAFYMEMQIQQSAEGSYFAAAGFNGGYFGLQELSRDGKKIAIFSVWEPGNPHDLKADQRKVAEQDRVKVLDNGEGVHVTRFGGEGTGGKSMMPFDWKIGETHKFLVTAKAGQNPEGTIFS